MAVGAVANLLSGSVAIVENLLKVFTREYECSDLDANYAGNILIQLSSRAVRGLRVVALDISIISVLLKSLPTHSETLQILNCHLIDGLCKEGNGFSLQYASPICTKSYTDT